MLNFGTSEIKSFTFDESASDEEIIKHCKDFDIEDEADNLIMIRDKHLIENRGN